MRCRVAVAALWRTARRLRGDRGGSAAVEFALVAPVFFALLFAIIEVALVFFAGQLLETATQDTARQIMTGQAQNGAYDKAKFKTELCKNLSTIFDCANGVYIDVQSYTTFSGRTMSAPIDSDKKLITATQYSPGTAGQVVIVRVFYQWQLVVTGLGFNISNLAGNKRLLMGTAAFRNEPYT